ncbi:Murein hydrolase activator NlpD [hydrothermal vent metagenome]|uniref:Murein hydrolase activator NlpD n=1 Tax=hydrothermal vent metagenome TaxID=652676 RepID=A0A3B0YU45_9ZZZZ
MMGILLPCLFAACSTHSVQAPIGDRSKGRLAGNPDSHIVRQGDTLYSVAFLYGYQIEDVAAWNGLKPPYTIYKGRHLRLHPPPARPVSRPQPKATPIAASQPKRRYPTRSRPKTATPPVVSSKPKTALAPAARSKVAAVKAHQPKIQNGRLSWAWPLKGPLLKRFKANSSGKKGIDIGGKSGTPVRAAADGKIVYSGSGLGGYGRLIIVKHNNDFLSAYAHNRKLLAQEGEWVKQGQVIAQMGSSGTDRTRLHFEIRKRGQPVDPLRYLP